jgi:hypothetical protein
VSLSSLKNYLILKVAPTPGKMIQFDVSQKETKILKKTMAFIESCVSLSVSCSLIQNKNPFWNLAGIFWHFMWDSRQASRLWSLNICVPVLGSPLVSYMSLDKLCALLVIIK